MCTVTIVPISNGNQSRASKRSGPGLPGLRIACNRDESRDRLAARPPEIHRFGDRRAILPIDPVSGGTWVAVNDAGLMMTLLNFNPHRSVPACRLKSRGGIIPKLLDATTLAEAIERTETINVFEYSLFRLILLDDSTCVELRPENGTLQSSKISPIDQPLLFTSSGLGDQLVEGPRRELFESMFQKSADWIHDQDRFHRHSWPGREHLSVCMSRADAKTVSQTIVTVHPTIVTMTYTSIPPDESHTSQQITLNRNP